MRHPESHIFQFTPETLSAWCQARAMPKYRARQILQWVYQRGVIDPRAMTNLAKRDRELLAEEMTFISGDILSHQAATDGTRKLLVQWSDEATKRRSDEGEIQGNQSRERDLATDQPTPNPLPILQSSPEGGDPTRQTECVMIPAMRSKETSPGRDARATENAGRLRRTACISSQVGCPVGCTFCASGLGGLDANLSAGRIVEQVWLLDQLVKGNLAETGGTGFQPDSGSTGFQPVTGGTGFQPVSGSTGFQPVTGGTGFQPVTGGTGFQPVTGGTGFQPVSGSTGFQPVASASQPTPRDPDARITNIVFMGMGEPLANFQSVVHAVRTIAADWGMAIGARRITISTVGLPKAIEKLAEQFELPITLALSLHAPNDDLRRELIPWAEYTTIDELLRACRSWFTKTGREITLEYILLGGVNDQPEHAAQLAGVAKSLRANINLIRYNEVGGLPYARPTHADVRRFQEILRERGVNAHIRASRGRDIAAACGQLRHEVSEQAR